MRVLDPVAVTARLSLVLLSGDEMLALMRSVAEFERLAGLRVADGAGDFFGGGGEVSPAWVARLHAWTTPSVFDDGMVAVHRESGLVVGSCGFKGGPDDTGAVEIAYGVIPACQSQGYATEIAEALVDVARRDPGVRLVRAHTAALANASSRVLEKCGFVCRGIVVDPEDGEVWRWEHSLS